MEILGANMAQYSAAQLQASLPKGDDRAQLRVVAQEFESLFAKQMLDSMRDTLKPDDDLFYGGMAQDIFRPRGHDRSLLPKHRPSNLILGKT